MEGTESLLDIALLYLSKGWSVLPLQGKIPRVLWQDFKDKRPSEDLVRRWWTDWPDAGIGVALGRVSNLVRLDADGTDALTELERLGGADATLEFTTPAGGRGWLYSYVDGLKTEVLWSGKDHKELRIQSDGAYTVLPPSRHPAGGYYKWVCQDKLSKVPQWLYDRAVERVVKDLVKELRPTLKQPEKEEVLQALEHIDPDEYDTWVQVGMALKSADMFDEWEKWSQKSGKFKEGECAKKWATFSKSSGGLTLRSVMFWAEKNGWKPPFRHEPITDLGNARVLARMADGKIKHCVWGWLAWDGARWSRKEAEKTVQELQKGVLQYRYRQVLESLARVANDNTEEGRKKQNTKIATLKEIRRHECETRIRGARALAASEPGISTDYDLYDKRPMLFNCANGTLDLESGELKDFNPADMLTQMSAVPYMPGAQCNRFLQFLEEILPDADVRAFLQKFLGCCLSGDTSAQIMPVFWGGGANGKSTLINVVMHVLGDDYSMKAKRDLLIAKRHNEHPTSVARLFGKRFVACVETAEEARLDEALVKEFTGGDPIAARRMREDEWQFNPTHKPVLVTNHKPRVDGTDDGIWRRLPLVPFTQQFLPGDPRRDPDLLPALLAEAPGVLSWMFDGCRAWLASNKVLTAPGAVETATSEYRGEQDKVGLFVADRCVVGADKKVRVDRLVEAYASWCSVNRHVQLNGNAFGRALTERGFPQEAKGSKYRTGLDLQ